jgi:hypothetical protein
MNREALEASGEAGHLCIRLTWAEFSTVTSGIRGPAVTLRDVRGMVERIRSLLRPEDFARIIDYLDRGGSPRFVPGRVDVATEERLSVEFDRKDEGAA